MATLSYGQLISESLLGAIRLHARHTGEPFNPALHHEAGQLLCSEADALAAHAEGLAARAAGLRCLCQSCEVDGQRVKGHEVLRGQYNRTRLAELRAAGVDDITAERTIQEEIALGAALRGITHAEGKS